MPLISSAFILKIFVFFIIPSATPLPLEAFSAQRGGKLFNARHDVVLCIFFAAAAAAASFSRWQYGATFTGFNRSEIVFMKINFDAIKPPTSRSRRINSFFICNCFAMWIFRLLLSSLSIIWFNFFSIILEQMGLLRGRGKCFMAANILLFRLFFRIKHAKLPFKTVSSSSISSRLMHVVPGRGPSDK